MKLVALCALVFVLVEQSPTEPGIAIEIDLATIDAGAFRLDAGDRVIVPETVERHAVKGGTVLEGTLAGGGSIVLARIGKTVTGVIRDGGTVLEVVPFERKHRLVHRPSSSQRSLHGIGWERAVIRGRLVSTARARGPIVIDVMFAYTGAVLRARGPDGARGVAEVGIAEINRACAQSGVDVRFRVAGVVRTAGSEDGKDLGQLYHDLLVGDDFRDAHAARAREHADILMLLVDKPRGGRGISTIMGEPATAVAIADHASLAYLTIAHELGHVMGARHDLADDDVADPFPYAHGYIGPAGRDIMSTPCARPETCPLVVRWSAPPAFGDAATADVARVLRETAPVVATFGDRL